MGFGRVRLAPFIWLRRRAGRLLGFLGYIVLRDRLRRGPGRRARTAARVTRPVLARDALLHAGQRLLLILGGGGLLGCRLFELRLFRRSRRRQLGQGRAGDNARGKEQPCEPHRAGLGTPGAAGGATRGASLASRARPSRRSSYQKRWCSFAQVSSTQPRRMARYAPRMPMVPM